MTLRVTADDIGGWGRALDELAGGWGDLFHRPEPRVVFAQSIEGLLAQEADCGKGPKLRAFCPANPGCR
ncbi:hypothetical protein GCM10010245_16940 [Streptomyces spectabilis]|nr:hypothetical protein GCM10010245_16940 [Streptomyces spectabilis]